MPGPEAKRSAPGLAPDAVRSCARPGQLLLTAPRWCYHGRLHTLDLPLLSTQLSPPPICCHTASACCHCVRLLSLRMPIVTADLSRAPCPPLFRVPAVAAASSLNHNSLARFPLTLAGLSSPHRLPPLRSRHCLPGPRHRLRRSASFSCRAVPQCRRPAPTSPCQWQWLSHRCGNLRRRHCHLHS